MSRKEEKYLINITQNSSQTVENYHFELTECIHLREALLRLYQVCYQSHFYPCRAPTTISQIFPPGFNCSCPAWEILISEIFLMGKGSCSNYQLQNRGLGGAGCCFYTSWMLFLQSGIGLPLKGTMAELLKHPQLQQLRDRGSVWIYSPLFVKQTAW